MKTLAVLGIIFLLIIYIIIYGLLVVWVDNGWAILFALWLGMGLLAIGQLINKNWKSLH